MRNLLRGRATDNDALRALVLAGEDSDLFEEPTLPHYHPRDRQIALEIDSLPFPIGVCREDQLLVARPKPV